MNRKTATVVLASLGGLLGGLGALALVLGAAGVLAGPSSSPLPALGAIPACTGCQIVIVSKDPNASNYTTVEEALDYMATQTHDEDHPWLVYVAPGTYEPAAPLQLIEHVHVQGAGQQLTFLTRGGSNTTPLVDGSSATVLGVTRSELSFLTVLNTGGGGYATGIRSSGAFMVLDHVTVKAGNADNVYGFAAVGTTFLAMFESEIVALGSSNSYGAYLSDSALIAFRSTVVGGGGVGARYGVYHAGAIGVSQIDSSVISGATNTINVGSPNSTKVKMSLLRGGPVAVAAGGSATCIAVHNESHVFSTAPAACP